MLHAVKEQALDYSMFNTIVLHKVKKYLGEDYSVEIINVTKNNSLEFDSLVLMKKGKNFAPNIYLQPYYESYLSGTSVDDIVVRLCNIYHHCTIPILDKDFTYGFEEMKDYIFYRLVSYEKNEKLLATLPFKRYLDLAITYHCLVRDDMDGIGTIRISNEHMNKWEVSINDLDELAEINTPILFPASINTMDEVISKILNDNMETDNAGDLSPDNINEFLDSQTSQNEMKMYILSNQKGINGASCILYQDVIRDFAEQINSDLYILPSSIHEVIIVPKEIGINKEVLTEMVRDVNYTQVPPEEILSDRVYCYLRVGNRMLF